MYYPGCAKCRKDKRRSVCASSLCIQGNSPTGWWSAWACAPPRLLRLGAEASSSPHWAEPQPGPEGAFSPCDFYSERAGIETNRNSRRPSGQPGLAALRNRGTCRTQCYGRGEGETRDFIVSPSISRSHLPSGLCSSHYTSLSFAQYLPCCVGGFTPVRK